MNKKELLTAVEELIKTAVVESGFILWQVDYYKENDGFTLLIEVDAEGGISLDKCIEANNIIEPLIDEADLIKDAYTLEVSSAGVERQLKTPEQLQYAILKQADITIKLYAPKNGNKTFNGKLKTADNDKIILLSEDGETEFTLKEIASIKAEFN